MLLPCSVQNIKLTEQMQWMLWMNKFYEILYDLLKKFLILHQPCCIHLSLQREHETQLPVTINIIQYLLNLGTLHIAA